MGRTIDNYWAFSSLAELEKMEAGMLELIEMSLRIGRMEGVPRFEMQLADIRARLMEMRASRQSGPPPSKSLHRPADKPFP